MNHAVNDNLIETRNKLVEEISSLTDAQFNSKTDKNSWSIAQVCHHLVLVEQSSIKAIAWGLKEAESASVERKNIEHFILDRTRKIKAPKIVEPGIEPLKVIDILDLLNESRNRLMALIDSIEDKSILMKKSVKHPAIGELPLDQWIEQIYLHEQRHIEQIKELKYHLHVN
jgi:hypothetical protein